MRDSKLTIFAFILTAALLIPISVRAEVAALTATQTATPGVTLVVTPSPTTPSTETLPPPESAEFTNTPTATFVPTPSQTPIPVVPETGLPMVIPLMSSGPPTDGFGPNRYPFYINPLTGMVVGDPSVLNNRPVAVKVTNYPRYVRPQSGLSMADLVFEYYMEWGIPRFIAVFYGQQAEKVGPVRSGRLFDEHIFRMYDSFFVFGYADVRVIEYFEELEKEIVRRFVLENDTDHAKTCGVDLPSRLCRDRQLEGYNTMFADIAAVQRFFELNYNNNQRPDLHGMYFSYHVTPSVEPGTILKLRYSPSIYNYWEFDPKSGLYLRWQETEGNMDLDVEHYSPHYDALTGDRLSASNVVFMVVDHKFHAYTEGSHIMGMNLNGHGRAFVFRDGFYYPAQWYRPEEGGVLQILTPEGDPFPLKPGQTWFEVVSQYTELEREGSTWRFHFQLPPVPNGRIYELDPDFSPLEWFYEDQNPGKIMPWNGVIDTPLPTQEGDGP
jgi:hypothetical protein